MKFLITGGAGYIGSHVAHRLVEAGHAVVIYDSLLTGFQWAVPKGAELVVGDVRDTKALESVFSAHQFSGVLHFAALTQVEESVRQPLKYFDVNTVGTLRVLEAMKKHKVKNIVYSSTAALYGMSEKSEVSEEDEAKPLSPYGESKLFAEKMLRDFLFGNKSSSGHEGEFCYTILRYFNVAGAHPDGILGQATAHATHLIKVACEVATNKRDLFQIYGNDYQTPDGTCVRDFIHVCDLAEAHLLALEKMIKAGQSDTFNVGYGRGYSVKDVLRSVEKVSGKKLKIEVAPRRAGDIPSVIANVDKIKKVLNFKPAFADLDIICRTAFEFEKKLTQSTAHVGATKRH